MYKVFRAGLVYLRHELARGIGDIKGVALHAVMLGVYTVEGEGGDGVYVCPQRVFGPGGVNFAAGDVAQVFAEGHRDIARAGRRRAKMYGNRSGNDRQAEAHMAAPFLWRALLSGINRLVDRPGAPLQVRLLNGFRIREYHGVEVHPLRRARIPQLYVI